jgi:hypothetical protein
MRTRSSGILLGISLLVAACTQASANRSADTDSSARRQAQVVIPAREAPCTQVSAGQFIKEFSDDIDLQRKWTADPLETESLDETADPEPHIVTKTVSHAELKFPVMPSSAEQKRRGLEQRISSKAKDEAEFVLFKPDTDYKVLYRFHRNTCWTLTKKVDESL